MAKPSEDMKNKIKATGLMTPEDVETVALAFEANYIFNQEPPQQIVDIMFEVFFTGMITGRDLGKSVTGCGPTRCATCDGRCGK
jgi:hypothetical protein